MNQTAKTTLQIPMPLYLKKDSEKIAFASGFSSLQELIRVILVQINQNKLSFRFGSVDEFVTPSLSAQKRYKKMEKDYYQGKNFSSVKSVDEFLKKLK
jgi:hypothetical protein